MIQLRLKKKYEPRQTYEYELFDGDTVLGKIQIRMHPSHSDIIPSDFASHIYYEIEKPFRRKGYGKTILNLGLREAKRLGLREVIVACDGDFLEQKPLSDGSGMIRKYRISLR
jgi:predicted acetyltransferase